MKEQETEQGIHQTIHDYQKGDPVKIKAGAFKEYEAIVTGTSEDRVLVMMSLFNRETPIPMKYHQIEPA